MQRSVGHTLRIALCVCIVTASDLQAQSRTPESMVKAPFPVDTTPLPASLKTITTDTGDFAPGHRNYDRYLDPRWCIAATENTLMVQQYKLQAMTGSDTILNTPAKDTLPDRVKVVVGGCTAHLTTSDTAAQTRYRLARFVVALATGKDTEAGTLLAGLVHDAPTVEEKAWSFVHGIAKYLDAKPARITAALSATAQLDTLPSAPVLSRINAHWQLLKFGKIHDDRALIQRQAEVLVELSRILTTKDFEALGLFTLWEGYREMRDLVFISRPDSVRAIAQQLQREYQSPSLARMIAASCQQRTSAFDPHCAPIASLAVDSVMSLLAPSWAPHITQAAQPLRADFLFSEPGRDATVPVPGAVSIVLRLAPWCVATFVIADCQSDYDEIRQLAAKYGSKRVSLTILVYAPPYTMFDELQTPDSVAESYRWYLQDYIKLPVSVAVRNMRLALEMPAPDGRRFYGASQSYSDVYSQNYDVVVDGSGHVIYKVGNYQRSKNQPYDDFRRSMIDSQRDLTPIVSMLEDKLLQSTPNSIPLNSR